jgi:hypothetical protein
VGQVAFFAADRLPRKNYDDIARSLRRGEYVSKIHFEFPGHGTYTTYLKQIPMQPAAADAFKLSRRTMMRNVGTPAELLEKVQIGWFGLPRVLNAVALSTVLRRNSFGREYIRRWFRMRMRHIADLCLTRAPQILCPSKSSA